MFFSLLKTFLFLENTTCYFGLEMCGCNFCGNKSWEAKNQLQPFLLGTIQEMYCYLGVKYP